MHRIKSIDGLRAISILFVLIGHGVHTIYEHYSNYYITMLGEMGVSFFFVISGYLITKLLLIEAQKNGKISLRKFYARRTIRIFPVFYAFILVVVLLKVLAFPDIFTTYSTVAFAALYIWNYKHLISGQFVAEQNGNWYFGHFWSLSMEEQFYLFWPVLFRLFKVKHLKLVVIGILVGMPLMRVATYFISPDSRGQLTMMLHTGGDTILLGCLGAIMEAHPKLKRLLQYLNQHTYWIFFSFVYLLILHPFLCATLRGGFSLLIGFSIRNVIVMIIIFWSIQSETRFSRFLNHKIMVQIGLISYSLYIWQQLFLSNLSFSGSLPFPINLILVFVVAFISYYCLEKPILNLKHHPRLKKYFQ